MKVNELNITITKAIVTSITINLDMESKTPEFEVTGKLLTDQGREVSSFQFATNHWTDSKKIEVPMSLHSPSAEIFKIITPVIYEKINGVFPQLGE